MRPETSSEEPTDINAGKAGNTIRRLSDTQGTKWKKQKGLEVFYSMYWRWFNQMRHRPGEQQGGDSARLARVFRKIDRDHFYSTHSFMVSSQRTNIFRKRLPVAPTFNQRHNECGGTAVGHASILAGHQKLLHWRFDQRGKEAGSHSGVVCIN